MPNSTITIRVDGKVTATDTKPIPEGLLTGMTDHLDLTTNAGYHHMQIDITFDPPIPIRKEG